MTPRRRHGTIKGYHKFSLTHVIDTIYQDKVDEFVSQQAPGAPKGSKKWFTVRRRASEWVRQRLTDEELSQCQKIKETWNEYGVNSALLKYVNFHPVYHAF